MALRFAVTPPAVHQAVKKSLLLVVTTSTVVASTEVALRVWYPRTEMFYSLTPGLRRTFQPDPAIIPGVSGPAVYEVGDHGIRGAPFGETGREYRFLAIGASTTACLYLDEKEAWSSLVEDALATTRDGRRVWVGNIGRSGLTSRHHVHQLTQHTRQYPTLDAVIMLVGINDMALALGQGHAYEQPRPVNDPEARDEDWPRAFAELPGALHAPRSLSLLHAGAPWFKATASWQLLKRSGRMVASRLAGTGLVQDQQGRVYERWRTLRRGATRLIDELPSLDKPLVEYERNLREIGRLAHRRDVRTILVTQPTLWRDDNTAAERRLLWMGGFGAYQIHGGDYYTPAVLGDAMTRYNETLLRVCASMPSLECADLASVMPATTEMFYDDVHFTEAGARFVADFLTRYLRARPPFGKR